MTYEAFCRMWTEIHEFFCTNTGVDQTRCNYPRESGSSYCPWCRSELAFLKVNDDYQDKLDEIVSLVSIVEPLPGDTLGFFRQESDAALRARIKAKLK